MKRISKIEFQKNGRKFYMIIKYDDGSHYTKKLNDDDKQSLFICITDIQILNKYK